MVETMVGLGLSGIVLSLAVGALFQAWGVQRTQRQDMVAVGQLRNAERWLAYDLLNAHHNSLDDGGAPVPAVSLSWTDASSVPHTVNYSLEGQRLVRTFDGMPVVVARGVLSVAFSRSANTLFATLEVLAHGEETQILTLRTYLRAGGGP